MKRIVGKLNTVTVDGRMVRGLTCLDEPIPVERRPYRDDLPHIIGSALCHLEGEDIVAEITTEPTVAVEDLTPHMSVIGVEFSQENDVLVMEGGVLRSLYLDQQPDAFGDLNQ